MNEWDLEYVHVCTSFGVSLFFLSKCEPYTYVYGLNNIRRGIYSESVVDVLILKESN